MTSVLYEQELDEEHIKISVTQGGMHVSDLSEVLIVQCTPASDVDAYVSAKIVDGRNVYFYKSNTADEDVWVTLKGRK